jgi:pimeloyl-ACP methyl ester carboxylesterase
MQPFFSAPISSKPLHWVLEWLQHRPQTAKLFSSLMRVGEIPTAMLFALTAGPAVGHHRKILRQYFDDVLGPSFTNYLRLFQELDAHSMYHLLPEISAPALVISGALDLLTPARQSFEMARRLPDAEHLKIARGTHFVLVERPEIVVPAIDRFARSRARW